MGGTVTAEDEEERAPSDWSETETLGKAAGSDRGFPPGSSEEDEYEDEQRGGELELELELEPEPEPERERERAFLAFFPLGGDAAAGTPSGREPESADGGGGGMATPFWLPARPPFFLLFFLALVGGADANGAALDADADADA